MPHKWAKNMWKNGLKITQRQPPNRDRKMIVNILGR